MQSLPYVPVDPQWLSESPAYLCGDAKVVRAFMRLLGHAWNANPAGTVPVGFPQLCEITGLDEASLGKHHEDLLDGWRLEGGRYHFAPMFDLCQRINDRFGSSLQSISDQSAAVVQDPDAFVLTSPEVVSTPKGKHRLPKGWVLSQDLRNWCRGNGFVTDDDIAFIFDKFTSHYYAKGEMMINWNAAFQNFALKEDKRNLPSFCRRLSTPLHGTSRASRYGAAGASALAHNTDAINAALMRRRGSIASGVNA